MKNFILTILAAVLAFVGAGNAAAANHEKTTNNYERMWADVSKAFNDDLPKTALDGVIAIRTRAAAEGNQPQLLRALCTEFTLAHEISPDSDAVVVRRIEDALARETGPVEKALWMNALGQLKHDGALLMASVDDVEALAAAKATQYVPAFAIEGDSYAFGYDVLHVLGATVLDCHYYGPERIAYSEQQGLYERMRAVYEAQQNELAVLVMDYRYQQYAKAECVETGRLIERIRTIAPQYTKTDKKHRCTLAHDLLQWAENQEASSISASWDWESRINYPAMDRSLEIRSKNVAKVEVRFHRIEGLTNRDYAVRRPAEEYKAKKGVKHLALSIGKELTHTPAHEFFSDTLHFQLPDAAGIYLVELLTDGKVRDTQWLQVSRLMPVTANHNSTKGEKAHLIIADARTGQPLTDDVHLHVHAPLQASDEGVSDSYWKELKPDAEGYFDVTGYDYRTKMAISAGGDSFFPEFTASFGGRGYFHSTDITETYARLFTDRAIYRPGQKVMLSGMVYSRHNDDYRAAEGWTGEVVLQDTKRKDIASVEVATDEFGQFCGEFTLPSPTIPGRFAIVLRGNGVRTTEYFSVEEYKRPTFRVVLDAASPRDLYGKERYEKGDTLVLNGRVETFSGVAVSEARVTWTTKHEVWSWLRYGADNEGDEKTGEITADADGRFTLKVALDSEGYYRTTCEALASNGETASEAYSLYVGHPTPPPSEEQKDEALKLFDVKRSAKADEATLIIDFRALETQQPNNLKTSQPDNLQTLKPFYLFYNIVTTDGGLIRKECIVTEDDQMTFDLKWQESFGDGVTAYVAFLKDGVLYEEQMQVQKPLPEKQLKLEWSTFRDHLQPGERETWTLRVRRPDGSPADASVMARLYDASLDVFASRPWHFDLSFDRMLPRLNMNCEINRNYSLSWEKEIKALDELRFTVWESSMFNYYAMMRRNFDMGKKSARRLSAFDVAINEAMADDMAVPMMMSKAEAPMPVLAEAMVADAEESAIETEAAEKAMQTKVRENFNETAFFLPTLRTDAEGNVTINFTLPESLTQWNFTALAHEKNMNYGLLNDTIVAQKKLTAEIAAPRFLRAGDKTEIPVTVRNLTDAPHSGELIFVVTDAKTGKVLKAEKRPFSLGVATTSEGGSTVPEASASGPASTTTLFFALSATCDVNVRAVAQGDDFSDGEERNIPFIDGREAVQVSIPFSATAKGDIRLDLAPLNLAQLMKKDAQCRPTLTLEYCANPIWNVVRVVPALLEGEACSANDWAVRLYTIEVADFLSRQLRGTASAALVDSLVGSKDLPALRYSALDHLADYQRGDGGFSWFKGFYSSPWITADVCVLLARQQKMTGSRTATSMLERAVEYLETTAAEAVKEMKKAKATEVSEVMMRYLYVRQLMELAPGKDERYLLDLAAKEKKSLTMYGKSVLSQIVMDTHKEDALLALESLVEHTVSTPEMGRYFDTERAFGGWASYKIPTQTMAIEALGSAAKVGVGEIAGLTGKRGDAANVTAPLTVQNEMKLWLLQSKRTQKWESSRASADATYALLHGDCDPQAGSQLFQTLAPEDHTKRVLSPDEAAQAIKSGSYNINKDTDGLSWGALYADYTLPATMVEASSAGFTLSRTWEVKRDGEWTAIDAKTTVKVGDHVRQTITLRAERDYDFVMVECSRAACLETLTPLSGLCWMAGTQAYRMVRDSSNDYYFEHLAKGSHTFTEEFTVDRAGSFTTGIARVECTFAPEFRAYVPADSLKVAK